MYINQNSLTVKKTCDSVCVINGHCKSLCPQEESESLKADCAYTTTLGNETHLLTQKDVLG